MSGSFKSPCKISLDFVFPCFDGFVLSRQAEFLSSISKKSFAASGSSQAESFSFVFVFSFLRIKLCVNLKKTLASFDGLETGGIRWP